MDYRAINDSNYNEDEYLVSDDHCLTCGAPLNGCRTCWMIYREKHGMTEEDVEIVVFEADKCPF